MRQLSVLRCMHCGGARRVKCALDMELSMENRLTELEAKLTYAEDLLDELNRTVFRQQNELDFLKRELLRLAQQVREWSPHEDANPRDDIPPHY